MSKKRFWWSVGAVWFVMMFTDFLFHGVWLAPLYQQTAQFWRTQDEVKSMMPWMWFGQFVFSWAFVWIYSNGISKDNQWTQAFRYALAIFMVAKVPEQTVTWAMTPYPAQLVLSWFFVTFVQSVVAAYVMTWTFKPMLWKTAKAR